MSHPDAGHVGGSNKRFVTEIVMGSASHASVIVGECSHMLTCNKALATVLTGGRLLVVDSAIPNQPLCPLHS